MRQENKTKETPRDCLDCQKRVIQGNLVLCSIGKQTIGLRACDEYVMIEVNYEK